MHLAFLLDVNYLYSSRDTGASKVPSGILPEDVLGELSCWDSRGVTFGSLRSVVRNHGAPWGGPWRPSWRPRGGLFVNSSWSFFAQLWEGSCHDLMHGLGKLFKLFFLNFSLRRFHGNLHDAHTQDSVSASPCFMYP